eukprot:3116781-Amphidinium_carterae.1
MRSSEFGSEDLVRQGAAFPAYCMLGLAPATRSVLSPAPTTHPAPALRPEWAWGLAPLRSLTPQCGMVSPRAQKQGETR